MLTHGGFSALPAPRFPHLGDSPLWSEVGNPEIADNLSEYLDFARAIRRNYGGGRNGAPPKV
jgi:hypothetical protein